MVLLIDNYDSFSYNLYQLIGSMRTDITVIRNDEKTVEEIKEMAPSHIIISPGPGRPSDAGICEAVVKELRGKIPIFGVCLGHQAICEAYEATVTYAKQLMHGKTSIVSADTTAAIFKDMPEAFAVARYHSLAVDGETLKEPLKVIAKTKDNEVMAVCDAENKVYGVQFHPESILTPMGREILVNFFENV